MPGNYEIVQVPEQGHQVMNNETNKQVETFEKNFFDWLLSKSSSTEISTVRNSRKPIDNIEAEFSVEEEWEELDPLNSEEIDCSCYDEIPPMTLGEVPTVYNRFELLLQNRLKTEIESKPPLFPWEKSGYDTDYPDVEAQDWVSPTSFEY